MDITDARSHYHIHWQGQYQPDGRTFLTRESADEHAKQIMRPQETYVISAYSKECPRCTSRRKLPLPLLMPEPARTSGAVYSN